MNKHQGKWVREDDWIGERHKLNSSTNYNFLLNEEVQKENSLKKVIERLEKEISTKDRTIEALEKYTPTNFIRLQQEHTQLINDYNKLQLEKRDLNNLLVKVVDAHNFPRTFQGMEDLSQEFTNTKNKVIRIKQKKEDAIKKMNLDLQDKLRQINMLFDPNSENYSSIDFGPMCDGLRTVLANKDSEITTLKGEKVTLTAERDDFIININNLESQVDGLIGTEFELKELREKFFALETFYKQAGLPKLWDFTNENFRDLFKIYAKEELFIAQEKLAGRLPKENWEDENGLNDWINFLLGIIVTG